jgi:hypothetical protein
VPVAHRHVVFTIPKALRGLFERERSLLGLLARTAYETVRRVLKAVGEGEKAAPTDAVPGFVASIQTFGSYANFHPHVHAIVTAGVFARDGTFHAVAWPPVGVFEEVFRRLLLASLVRAERLTEEFAAQLASWRHSGFSVYAASRVDALDLDGLERLARYVTRPALAAGAVTIREDGRVDIATPRPADGRDLPDARRARLRPRGGVAGPRRAPPPRALLRRVQPPPVCGRACEERGGGRARGRVRACRARGPRTRGAGGAGLARGEAALGLGSGAEEGLRGGPAGLPEVRGRDARDRVDHGPGGD